MSESTAHVAAIRVAGLTRATVWQLVEQERAEILRHGDLADRYGELATYMVDHYIDRVDDMTPAHVLQVLQGRRPLDGVQ